MADQVMRAHVTTAVRAEAHYQRFNIEVRVGDVGAPLAVTLTVTDTKSGAGLELDRREVMPLYKAIREALKSADDVAAGLPRDPVDRAAARVPVRNHPMALGRASLVEQYRRELAALQERHAGLLQAYAARFERGARSPAPDDDNDPVS